MSFHAACTAPDGFSLFAPHYITQNTFQILSVAAHNKVKKFIYCSIMERYGNQLKVPYTEDLECFPATPYAVGKYALELVIKQICEWNGIDYTIIVPHNIYGPRKNYTDPYRNVASIMINRILKGEQPIIYEDGEQKRCFSYVDDCISCIKKVISQDNLNGEIINIGPDEEFVSINKLTTCSSKKARKLIGYETKTSLREGLEQLVKDIKEKWPKDFQYNYQIEIKNENTPDTWKKKMI